MKRSLLVLAVLVGLGTVAQAGVIITGVAESNGDAPGAFETGQTYNNTHGDMAATNPQTVPTFGEDVLAFSDRGHEYNGVTAAGLPTYLVGGDYVQAANNSRDNGTYQLDVTLGQPSYLYVVRDTRNAGSLPAWFTDSAGLDFAAVWTGDQVGYDEGGFKAGTVGPGVDINRQAFVYQATDTGTGNTLLALGTYSLYQSETANRNMYGVIASLTAPPPPPEPHPLPPEADRIVLINFEDAGTDDRNRPNADVCQPDTGDAFGDRGNGWSYGWLTDEPDDDPDLGLFPADNFETRDRDSGHVLAVADERYDSLNHMQKGDVNDTWEIAIDNGTYDLYLVCGDPDNINQDNSMLVEGIAVPDPTPSTTNFDEYEILGVVVSDGRLTIAALNPGADEGNAKISFLDVTPEPATLALLGFGLAGLMIRRKR